MKDNQPSIISIEYKIDLMKDILNHLLITLDPTNEMIVSLSQQLDKYLNEYNALKNASANKNNYEYIA